MDLNEFFPQLKITLNHVVAKIHFPYCTFGDVLHSLQLFFGVIDGLSVIMKGEIEA